MTRRSIYIGIAAILALALTAGFAYGAGATHGPQARNHPGGLQRVGSTSVMPGSLWNNRGQASQVSGHGQAFREQMRGWMQNWMGNHDRYERSWGPTGYGRQGAQGTHDTHDGYGDDHHATSGHWGGSGSGSHGYDHGDGHDGDHDFW